MSTWLKNNLIKSWFLRRVGHWFIAWKVKWRAPGLRRKFGHKFTHIFYFHRGKVAKFLKEELFLRCPENQFFSLPKSKIYLSKLSQKALCVRIKCLEFWQRSFRPSRTFPIRSNGLRRFPDILWLKRNGHAWTRNRKIRVSWNSEEQQMHTMIVCCQSSGSFKMAMESVPLLWYPGKFLYFRPSFLLFPQLYCGNKCLISLKVFLGRKSNGNEFSFFPTTWDSSYSQKRSR